MKKKILIIIIFVFLLSPMLILANSGYLQIPAGDVLDDMDNTAEKLGYDTNPNNWYISNYITAILKYTLGLLGLIFLILIITSGIEWMTAGGNDDRVKKAKTKIINASKGLGIILGAYIVVSSVLPVLFKLFT